MPPARTVSSPHEKPQESIRQRLLSVEKIISHYAVGQREMVEAMLLATLSRHHCLFVGPPGCNKTGVIEKFVHLIGANQRGEAMRNGQVDEASLSKLSFTFTVTLNKYDQPEALLGPISPSALRQDRWERNLRNTIADCDFAHLGEVFSGNGPTLRSTVRILNERVYDMGGITIPVRLRSVFADTNEYPPDSMMAVYDRFMLRFPVDYTPDNAKPRFLSMMKLPKWSAEMNDPLLSLSDLDVAYAATRRVEVSTEAIDHLWALRQSLIVNCQVSLSDRRWVQSQDILRASAWLRGSKEVEPEDFWTVFRFVAWHVPSQREGVLKVLEEYRAQNSDSRELKVMEEARKIHAEAMRESASEEDRVGATLFLQNALGKVKDDERLRELKRLRAEIEKMVDAGTNDGY